MASYPSGLRRGYCPVFHLVSPSPTRTCRSATVNSSVCLRRRSVDAILTAWLLDAEDTNEARSVRGPEEVVGCFDSPALLARNCCETGRHGCVAGDGCCLHCRNEVDLRNCLSYRIGGSRSKSRDRGNPLSCSAEGSRRNSQDRTLMSNFSKCNFACEQVTHETDKIANFYRY